MDLLAAKVLFYYARFCELLGTGPKLRPKLLSLHRSAVLRGDDESTAVLVNLILRDLVHANLIDQADKFIEKSGGLPGNASNPQAIRFLYYTGRIKAIHLDYSAAHENLQQAIRKAPSTHSAIGFLQATHKLAIIVQLLMGDVPERSVFRPLAMRIPLEPYRQLVLAVRAGDLAQFAGVVSRSQSIFAADQTLPLIQRMRHNVIKTGMRQISIAYSSISLRDICLRLGLDSEEDAEYIVAKTIRDGVISASIDHTNGIIRSSEGSSDVYATGEPNTAFHARLTYCLDLHNQSVRAMRYPNTQQRINGGFTDAQELRELDMELQMQLEDDMDDF
jgi:26S proteasome regulatory subunit N3